jgi:hypothetical protein
MNGHEHQLDREMEVKHWTHPANSVKIIEGQEDSKHAIYIYIYIYIQTAAITGTE